VLMPYVENEFESKRRVSAFTQALADFGWTDGANVRMDLRWFGDDINRIRALAQELVGLQPDVVLASSTPSTAAVQRETRTIPIVGNITGFALWEASMDGKWLSGPAQRLMVIAEWRRHVSLLAATALRG
jgi:ABC transporter substrate binding protein